MAFRCECNCACGTGMTRCGGLSMDDDGNTQVCQCSCHDTDTIPSKDLVLLCFLTRPSKFNVPTTAGMTRNDLFGYLDQTITSERARRQIFDVAKEVCSVPDGKLQTARVPRNIVQYILDTAAQSGNAELARLLQKQLAKPPANKELATPIKKKPAKKKPAAKKACSSG